MNAEVAVVFFSLVLGISVDWIQASSPSTTTESSPSSSSTTALPKSSSTGNTTSGFPTPSSPAKAQVRAGPGSVNSTDLSTTTSPSSSSIVAETSTILASISQNATVSSITAASFTPSSGILSMSQSKSANLIQKNTTEVVGSSVGSLSASTSTVLTSSSRILQPSQTSSSSSLSSSKGTVSSSGLESPSLDTTQASSSSTTTGSSPSSSSTTASPKGSSTKNTISVFPTPSSPAMAEVPAGAGSVSSTDLSTTTSPSSSSIVAETSTYFASIGRNATVSSITAASLTPSSGILSTSQSKSANLTEKITTEVVSSSVGSLSASASTVLTSSSRILQPSLTTSSSSLSSSKGTVSSSGLESPSLDTTQGFWSASEMIPQTTEVSTDNTPSSSTGTFANTRISATLSERLSSYLASTPATHTTSSRPTIPPKETKMVNMEVTLNMEFRKEYNDVNSPIYTELVANLTNALIRVYKEVDGFLDVRVLFIRRGSIVCNYIVILASNSTVADDDLKNELEKGRKDGKFPFDVKGITVIEDSDAVAAKTKLPQWAMTTMIVLGALAFCFLVIAICACIKYRNATSSENYIYDVPPGKLDMRAYDAISMGHMRANVDGNTSTAQRRLVSSHENPTYGS